MKNKDQYLSKVFQSPPMTAFRRDNNLKSILIRSKVPKEPELYPKRQLKGMKKCGKPCPFILEEQEIKTKTNKKLILNKQFTCESFNVI